MGLFEAAHEWEGSGGGGGGKKAPSLKFVTHTLQRHSYTLPKEVPKNI